MGTDVSEEHAASIFSVVINVIVLISSVTISILIKLGTCISPVSVLTLIHSSAPQGNK